MAYNRLYKLFIGGFIFLVFTSCSYKKKLTAIDIQLHPHISSGMIFKEGDSITLGGWCNPNGVLSLRLNSDVKYVEADAAGNWNISLPPIDYKKEFSIIIEGKKKTLELNNLMMGEVWVIIGDTWLSKIPEHFSGKSKHIYRGSNSDVRIYTPVSILNRNEGIKAKWESLNVSAKEYRLLFAQLIGDELNNYSHKPIGIINLAWPGTDFSKTKSGDTLSQEVQDSLWLNFNSNYKRFTYLADSSFNGIEKGALDRFADDWDWSDITFPIITNKRWYLKNRIVWLRKKVYISSKYIKSDFNLHLGPIRGQFDFYINGVHLEKFEGESRDFTISIPDSLIKVWSNQLTIRMVAGDSLSGIYTTMPVMENTTTEYYSDLSEDWLLRTYYEPALPDKTLPDQFLMPVFDKYVATFLDYNVSGVLVAGGIHQYKNASADEIEEALIQIYRSFNSDKNYMCLVPLPEYIDSLYNSEVYNKTLNNQLVAASNRHWDIINSVDVTTTSLIKCHELMAEKFISEYMK